MTHVKDHCNTPKITRAWRKLGAGATWTCSCNQAYRLAVHGGYDGDYYLVWEKVE